MKSSAVVFEGFQAFARESPFSLSVVQQKDQDREQSFHLHHLETILCSEDEFRLRRLCIAPPVANNVRNGPAPESQLWSIEQCSMAAIHERNIISIFESRHTRIEYYINIRIETYKN